MIKYYSNNKTSYFEEPETTVEFTKKNRKASSWCF